jgi:hypothetical protein
MFSLRKPRPIFAIAYDFDGTLAPGNMQEHSFIPAAGKQAQQFWHDTNTAAEQQQGDPNLLYMYKIMAAANGKRPLSQRDLKEHGAKIKLFDGVEDWFPRISKA